MAEELELSTIYRRIAEGKGPEYELLFSLQGMFLAVTEFDPVTDEPLHSTLDDILHGLASFDTHEHGWHNDRLQHIADFVSSAVRNLIEVLHEKNLREHRITRPEQVHEVDSRCMRWLAKRPGFTIKQKIASAQRMMGVYHTTSLDTAENRLFKAFMQNLDGLLSEKESAAGRRGKPLNDDAKRFAATLHKWLKSEECSMIGKWNNTPPNNTLLNDKNYRKIWKAHIMLKNLSKEIQHDIDRLEELKKHALFWLTAARLNQSDNVRFKQGVLFPDYKNLSFSDTMDLGGFAFFNSWKKFRCSLENDSLKLLYDGQEKTYPLPKSSKNIEDIYHFAEQACTGLFPKSKFSPDSGKNKSSEGLQTALSHVAAVDLSSVLPSFTLHNKTKGEKKRGETTKGVFTKKLLHQSHYIEQNNKKTWFPCSAARSKLIDSKSGGIKTFSIHSIFNRTLHTESDNAENKNHIERACADFAKTIKGELRCQKCLYITSDDVDDFSPSVSAFKHRMNTAFSKTEIMPRSIAALFSRLSEIHRQFSEGDRIEVRTIYDDYEIRTTILLESTDKKQELEKRNTETKGLVFKRLTFQRTPLKKTADIQNTVPKSMDQILTTHDASMLKDSFSADDFHFESKISAVSVPSQKKEIIIYAKDDTSCGAVEYEHLQSITPDIPLWMDSLPKLSMFDATGREYDLVNPEKENVPIRPVVGCSTKIPISWKFSFPAGKTFYEFPLVQGEKKEKTNYFAYIKDSSFPLEKEIECRLSLTYTYGMPIPYSLEFIPISKPAEFNSVTVKWENETHRDYIHVQGPEYIDEDSWETVCNKDIKGRSNLELLDQSVEKTRYLAETGWVICKIAKSISPDLFLTNYCINGVVGACRRNDFPKNCQSQIDIAMDFRCSFTPVRDINGKLRQDRYGNIQWGAFDPVPLDMELEKSSYFYQSIPVLNLWDQGRSTGDADFPGDLYEKIKKLSDYAVKVFEDPQTPKATRDEICNMLAALHRDTPPSLYNYLERIIENTFERDENIQESLFHHKRLVFAFGYAVGTIELPWQKELLKKEIQLLKYEETVNFGIEILGIALWKTRHGIFHLAEDEVKDILSASIDTIEAFIDFFKKDLKKQMIGFKEISKSNSIKIWRKRFLFLKAVELILALYRVREKENEAMLKIVAPTPDNTEIAKLKRLFPDLEEFCRQDIECSNNVELYNRECDEKDLDKKTYKRLESRIQLEIVDENWNKSTVPDYLYALEKYTNGEDCNITILSIQNDN